MRTYYTIFLKRLLKKHEMNYYQNYHAISRSYRVNPEFLVGTIFSQSTIQHSKYIFRMGAN